MTLQPAQRTQCVRLRNNGVGLREIARFTRFELQDVRDAVGVVRQERRAARIRELRAAAHEDLADFVPDGRTRVQHYLIVQRVYGFEAMREGRE